jgi:hypothetical protein
LDLKLNIDMNLNKPELEPVGKWYTGPVRPVEKFYRSGPAEKRTGWNHFSTGEIPANSGEKVANF